MTELLDERLALLRVDVLRRVDGGFRVLRRTIHLDQSVLLSRNLTTFF